MARLTGPLASFGAVGQIGHTIALQRRNGRNIARAYQVSPDPRTPSQVEMREVMRWLTQAFRLQGLTVRTFWNTAAAGKPYTGANLFVRENIARMKSDTDLANLVLFNNLNHLWPPATFAFTPLSNGFRAEATPPALPPGSSIQTFRANWLHNKDPHLPYDNFTNSTNDNSAPYLINVGGLGHGTAVYVSCGFAFLLPSGSVLYGPAEHSTLVTI